MVAILSQPQCVTIDLNPNFISYNASRLQGNQLVLTTERCLCELQAKELNFEQHIKYINPDILW